jgi:hypothetical protein
VFRFTHLLLYPWRKQPAVPYVWEFGRDPKRFWNLRKSEKFLVLPKNLSRILPSSGLDPRAGLEEMDK